jgi:hypothetical protein
MASQIDRDWLLAGFLWYPKPLLLLPVTSLWHTTYECTECPRKGEHILNIFAGKMNRARRLQFSSHERANQNIFSSPLSILLHIGLSCLCCSHSVNPVFRFPEIDACAHSCVQSCARDTSIVNTISAAPLSCGETRTFLSLFIYMNSYLLMMLFRN